MYPSTYKKETNRRKSAPSTSFCQNCQRREIEENVGTTTIINDYLNALHYINSCHTLINQIIKSRQSSDSPTISMPQMPNFLNVLTYIAKDVHTLSDLNNMDTLENLMRELNRSELPTGVSPSVGRSSQTFCHMTDKEVEAYHLPCDDAQTSTKRNAKLDHRVVTGIPRPIRTLDRTYQPRPRPSSSPQSPTSGYGDCNRFCCQPQRTTDVAIQGNSTMILTSVNEESQSADPIIGSLLQLDKIQSNVETTESSTDETDEYAKKILLGTDEICTPSLPLIQQDRCAKKGHRVRSKTKRDYAMIQSFLKQWGIEMPSVDNESIDDMSISCGPSSLYLKYSELEAEKSTLQSGEPIAGSGEMKSERSEVVASRIVRKKAGSRKSRMSSRMSDESTDRINVFNSIAATAEGLENTFITNEKPVWQQTATLSKLATTTDESDIEPDSDQKSVASRHLNIMCVTPYSPKPATFQTNPAASYVITQKPKDLFLMPRRRHSHSDVGSDHNMIQSSDIDDEVFDRKRRTRGNIKVRQPVLPQKVLSNIGILTRTGQVKPEKERQLQELRSQLSTDMKTTLFRKPRNRKLESDDIIHLQTDLSTGKK